MTLRVRAWLVLCSFLMTLGSAAAPVYAETTPFPDMAKSWIGYQEAVARLIQRGSIQGYPDGGFHPKQTINRVEFLKIVFTSRTDVEPGGGECFDDIEPDAWYAAYVCAAKRRGIVSGYTVGGRTVFKPEQPIVFAEALKMALLAYDRDIQSATGEQWYRPFVDDLDRKKILGAWSYVPWDPITRERAADLIDRLVRYDEDLKEPRYSRGCGTSGGNASLTLTVNGLKRTYLLTQPRSARANTPSPLIVAFHGRTSSNERVRSYYGLDRTATDAFIAYPAGLSTNNATFSWSDPGDKGYDMRDVALFDAIVKEVSDKHCIDTDRIYVVGHSLGAWMASMVACARGGVVRASAVVGGATAVSNCTGPTAAMIINNPKDTLSHHGTAEAMRDVRLKENACQFTSERTAPESFACVEYQGCGKNPVVFCPHPINNERDGTYYPHLWPPRAGEEIVKFFEGL